MKNKGKKKHGMRYKRLVSGREERKCLLIVCEGEKTEPNYFKAFPIPLPNNVVVEGTGFNTLSLVDETERIQATKEKERDDKFDQVWCVFDKDDFSEFEEAIRKANKMGYQVAYSNEAFELWYLMHFCYVDVALSRKQYPEKITEQMRTNGNVDGKWRYRKNDKKMYELLLGFQETAIKHAKTLMKNGQAPSHNPSTRVHCLVEELNRLIR